MCRIVVIGILEEEESDLSKNLAELFLAEDEAEIGLQKVAKENNVKKVSKIHDVKYNEQESVNLKKSSKIQPVTGTLRTPSCRPSCSTLRERERCVWPRTRRTR